MPTVQEMANAHLSNVQKAIADLESQKKNIEDEITKLSVYLNEGIEELKKQANASTEASEV